MRKTLLLAALLFLSLTSFAQGMPKEHIIDEHFDSSSLPEGWTTIGYDGNESANWSVSPTSYSGGDDNEVKLTWNPQFVGITRLVSAPVDLTGIQNIVLRFKHYFDNYTIASNTIGVATSSDNGNSWHSVWTESYTITGQYNIEEKISTPDMGHDNVLFCIYFDGSSIDFKNWYFDDFEVKVQENLSVQLTNINIDERVAPGPLNVNFSVQNMGSTNIQSLEASYQIEEQEAITETFSVNISSFGTKEISFVNTENLLPGTYDITLNISKVNGTEIDAEAHSLDKNFSIAIAETQRIPMIEHFSSSTCAPCVLINRLMKELTENNPGKFTYVKYPVSWPGTGDPYNNQASNMRKNYYGVSTVPMIYLDAEAQVANHTPQSVTNAALQARYNTPAFAEIRGAFDVDGNTINLTADILSYVDLKNVKAYVSINEKITTGNVGSNGETEFHHIVMKMMNNGQGTMTDIDAGEYKRFEFSFDMSLTHMEEIDDLEVAVWLQKPDTKEIFNSHFLYEYTEHPYPAEDLHFSSENMTLKWNAPEAGTPTGYNVYINNELVLENTTELSYVITNPDDYCLAEVVALYDDKTSVSAVKMYSSQFETPENVNVNANVNEENIIVSWNATDNASSYNIYRNGELLENTTSTEYIDTNDLDINTEYCYSISAVYGDYESASSEETCAVYTSTEDIMTANIDIVPNPAKKHISISGTEINEISIYNSLGIMIEKLIVDDDHINVDVENYNIGMYFIKIKTDEGETVKKFIKE